MRSGTIWYSRDSRIRGIPPPPSWALVYLLASDNQSEAGTGYQMSIHTRSTKDWAEELTAFVSLSFCFSVSYFPHVVAKLYDLARQDRTIRRLIIVLAWRLYVRGPYSGPDTRQFANNAIRNKKHFRHGNSEPTRRSSLSPPPRFPSIVKQRQVKSKGEK